MNDNNKLENADHVCIINHGKIALHATPQQMKQRLLDRYVLVDAPDPALARRAAALARELRRPCVMDADAPQADVERLLASASHPVIPETLAVAVFGSVEAATRELARAGAELPVVTRGRGGAVAWLEGAVRRDARVRNRCDRHHGRGRRIPRWHRARAA